jgi:hypothetical protein
MFVAVITNLEEFMRGWTAIRLNLVQGIHDGVHLGCTEGAAEALATRRWKDRTGQTRAATTGFIAERTDRGASGWIQCLVNWASFLEEGTVPHLIWPKAAWGAPISSLKPHQTRRARGKGPHEHIVGRGRFLRWKDEAGDQHFARVVHHPGTAADGFIGRGVQKAERVILRELEIAAGRAQHRWLDT